MTKKGHIASTPLVLVKGLTVRYPFAEATALENLTFTLESGTLTMLVGPNGSGKSTLLKTLLGLLPYKGKIEWQHKPTADGKVLAQRTLFGYVPQYLDVDRSLPLSVEDFLNLALLTCKHDAATKKELISESLSKVHATPLRRKLLGELSGGQRQRVILARALLHNPYLLILDEPSTGIDAQGEALLYELLRDLVAAKDITILVATHELEAVSLIADQVLCLNRSLVCSGHPQVALKPSVYQDLYGPYKKPYHHHHD